ncbi:MAG: tetratricopeptide repeat protein, partial [Syntrophales bacterium]|nr:tetratricopeptide repeat protein [Syntrophales bacterium]
QVYLISGIFVLVLMVSCGWYIFRLNYEKKAVNIYNQAYDLQMKGDLNQAVKFYGDITLKYPDTQTAAIASYHLGNLYFRLQKIDASMKAYQELVGKASRDNDLITLAYEGLGYCYELRKDFKNALLSFEKAIKTDPKGSFEGINYRNIARIYEQMNNRGKAVEYYQKALNKNTDPFVDLLIKRKISSLS